MSIVQHGSSKVSHQISHHELWGKISMKHAMDLRSVILATHAKLSAVAHLFRHQQTPMALPENPEIINEGLAVILDECALSLSAVAEKLDAEGT